MKYIFDEFYGSEFCVETEKEAIEKLEENFSEKFKSVDDFNEWAAWAYPDISVYCRIEE